MTKMQKTKLNFCTKNVLLKQTTNQEVTIDVHD